MWNFLIFFQRYIQNTGIFRNRGIFRTLSTIYDGTFRKKNKKKSHLAHFLAQPWIKKKNPFYFRKRNPALFKLKNEKWKQSARRIFLILQKISDILSRESFSYISGNENPEKKSLYFRKKLSELKKSKTSTLKKFLILLETEGSGFKLKTLFIYFRKELTRPENITFQTYVQKISHTFSYKGATFSSIKHLLMIIIKCFFSFYILFYTQPVYFFVFWETFVKFMTILLLFLFFLYGDSDIFYELSFAVFLDFLDDI